MPFCPSCGKEVMADDRFCFNCGHGISMDAVSSQGQTPSYYRPMPPTSPKTAGKNPWAAALLNLFFPGIGYIYCGVGKDTGEVITGVLVFLFYFVGFGIGLVATMFTTSTATATSPASGPGVSPFTLLVFLVYLLPIAFAYDAYHRASIVL